MLITKQFPTVNIDYEQAAYEAVTKLIENGHKRIAFVTGPLTRDINPNIRGRI